MNEKKLQKKIEKKKKEELDKEAHANKLKKRIHKEELKKEEKKKSYHEKLKKKLKKKHREKIIDNIVTSIIVIILIIFIYFNRVVIMWLILIIPFPFICMILKKIITKKDVEDKLTTFFVIYFITVFILFKLGEFYVGSYYTYELIKIIKDIF